MNLPPLFRQLTDQFAKLPVIGHKTAERFVFYLLKQDPQEINSLATSLQELTKTIKICSVCYNFSEQSPCPICRDSRRAADLLCVVAESSDLLALEKTGQYQGKYFVLGGTINQLDGIGPEQLRFDQLIAYLKKIKTSRKSSWPSTPIWREKRLYFI